MRTNESTRRSAGRHALLLGIAAALTLGVLGTGTIAQSNEGPPRRWALTADEGGAARKVGAEPATTDTFCFRPLHRKSSKVFHTAARAFNSSRN